MHKIVSKMFVVGCVRWTVEDIIKNERVVCVSSSELNIQIDYTENSVSRVI